MWDIVRKYGFAVTGTVTVSLEQNEDRVAVVAHEFYIIMF